jgi:hypothetical protein
MPGATITISLQALTDEANAKLQAFFSGLGAKVQSMSTVGQAVGSTSEQLKHLQETSLLARDGFRGMEGVVLLLGGEHFPRLARGITTARMGLMALRTGAQFTGMSIASLVNPLVGVGMAVAAGVLAWKAYGHSQEEAAEKTRKLGETLRELPKVIADVTTLTRAGVIQPSQATAELEKMGIVPGPDKMAARHKAMLDYFNTAAPAMRPIQSYPGGPILTGQMSQALREQLPPEPGTVSGDKMRAWQEQMVKQGFMIKGGTEKAPTFELSPQIQAMEQLLELRKKVTIEAESGYKKEQAEAKKTYDEALEEVNKLASVAGHFFSGSQLEDLKSRIAATFTHAVTEIDFKKQQDDQKKASEAYAKQQTALSEIAKLESQKLEETLTKKALDEGYKREESYQYEYDERVRLFESQVFEGVITEQQYTEQVLKARVERQTAMEAVATQQRSELEEQLTLKALQEGKKREDNYEYEYQQRMDLINRQKSIGMITEQEYTALVLAETVKRLEGRRKEAEDAIRLEDARNAIALAKVQGRRALLDKDPDLSEMEKKSALLAMLREENDLLQRNIELNERRSKDMSLPPEARQSAETNLQGLNQRKAENQLEIRTTVEMGTFEGEFKRMLTRVQNEWSSWAFQAARTFHTVFEQSVNIISTGITALIMRTKSWGDALREIGRGLLASLVQQMSEMLVRWVLTHTVMAAVRRLFHATETAETAAHTTAQVGIHAAGEGAKTGSTFLGSIARGAIRLGETIFHGIQVGIRVAAHIGGEILATAVTIAQVGIRMATMLVETVMWLVKAAIEGMAAVASIPCVGPILAIAALGAILAAGFGAISGAFAEGGEPPVGKPALVGEKGPELFVPRTAGTIIPADQTQAWLQAGSLALAPVRPLDLPISTTAAASHSAKGSDGSSKQSPPPTLRQDQKFNFAVMYDKSQSVHWLKTTDGQAFIIDMVRRNFHKIA